MDNFRLIIGLPKMFTNGEWETIDTILTTGLEKYRGPNDLVLALGDGVKQMLTLMAVSKDMPEKIRRRHLPKLIATANFCDFFELMRFEFDTVIKAPVREEIKKMLRHNALTEVNWMISRMSLEEINGLINYLVEEEVSIDVRICISLTLKIYDEKMASRKSMLLLLANCV